MKDVVIVRDKWINKFIPFKNFKAVNILGFVFVANGVQLNEYDLNHESIHTKQIKEMLYLFFYLWYVFEYVIRFFQYFNLHKAYRNISFEREAYVNDRNLDYLKNRKMFSFLKYLKLNNSEYIKKI